MSALASTIEHAVENHPLGRQTSMRVGGTARWYATGSDLGAYQRLLDRAAQDALAVFCLGGGTNLLVADEGFEGLVLKYTRADNEVSTGDDGAVIVRASAGASLSSLARRLAREGIIGLEWAATVPGTIGGAAVNNAGAFGGCIADHLIDLDVVRAGTGPRTLSADELRYAYRASSLKHAQAAPLLVTSVRLRLGRGDSAQAIRTIKEWQARRTATQPRQLSAGSIFANPPGDYAGRLIEAVGLKGERRGDAEFSTRHANFIVNHGSASARAVFDLIRLAQDAVWSRFGTWLTPEVQPVGAWAPAEIGALAGPAERVAT